MIVIEVGQVIAKVGEVVAKANAEIATDIAIHCEQRTAAASTVRTHG